MYTTKFTGAFIGCLLFCASTAAQDQKLWKSFGSSTSDIAYFLNQRLNQDIDEMAEPGVAVSILHKDKVVIRNRKGLNSLEERRMITSGTPFYLASVAKPLTAQLILSLAEQDMLQIDDPIRKLMPDLPEYMQGIRVLDLLNHTSGIKDYYQYLTWREPVIDNDFVLSLLTEKADSLLFTPGEQFEYSNSNYIILAEIAEKVTARPFSRLLEDEVFKKASMGESFLYTGSENLNSVATGYRYDNHTFLINDYRRIEFKKGVIGSYNLKTRGAGGVFSTQADLEKWLMRFGDSVERDSRRVSGAAVDVDQYPGIGEITYHLGWYTGIMGNQRIYWHSGEFAGYRALLLYAPDIQFGIAIVSNNGNFQAEKIGLQVARKFIEINYIKI